MFTKKSLSRAVAGVAITATCLYAGAAPSHAATSGQVLGGVSVQKYCDVLHYYNPDMWFTAQLVSWSAYGWRCQSMAGWFYGVDMNKACRLTYNIPSYAKTDRPGDPWSWYCVAL